VTATGPAVKPTLSIRDGKLLAHCGGGGVLRIDDLELDGHPVRADVLVKALGRGELPLGNA